LPSLLPEAGIAAPDGVRAIVEGAFVGNFDPGYYKSDRKERTRRSTRHHRRAAAIQRPWKQRLNAGRIVGESQNFTRDLVNEPSNRMTPTMMADRAKKMAAEVGLKCEVYGADKIKELKMGAFWGVAQGSDEPPALIVLRYEPAGAPEKPPRPGRQRNHLRHRRHLHQARRRHGENEVRHGRRRHHDRRHARHRPAQAESESHGHRPAPPKTCRPAKRKSPATCRSPCPASPSRSSTPTPKAAWSSPTASATRASSAARTWSTPPR
jgi:hypothetical protein